MKIVCISDTHTMHEDVPLVDGDVIVCTGDISYTGSVQQVEDFLEWFGQTYYKHKVLIAGNHDWGFETRPEKFEKMCEDHGVIYLNDSGIELDGIKFWGSPVQPEFCNWAFNRKRTLLEPSSHSFIGFHWELIPEDTDVLLTHGPPYGILDRTTGDYHPPKRVGCRILRKVIDKIQPKLHVFGHIHERRGKHFNSKVDSTTFINASSVTSKYVVRPEPAEVFEFIKE